MKQELIFQETQQKNQIERRMSRSFCPNCHETKNCFVVDWIDYRKMFPIFLCLDCCKDLCYKPIIKNKSKCVECGELFDQKKSTTCPVCWIKYFEVKHGKSN